MPVQGHSRWLELNVTRTELTSPCPRIKSVSLLTLKWNEKWSSTWIWRAEQKTRLLPRKDYSSMIVTSLPVGFVQPSCQTAGHGLWDRIQFKPLTEVQGEGDRTAPLEPLLQKLKLFLVTRTSYDVIWPTVLDLIFFFLKKSRSLIQNKARKLKERRF